MVNLVPLEPVDYLVIGHLAHDLTPDGPRLGGTAAYSALTARAFGLRVGIVTACGSKTNLDVLDGIPAVSVTTEHSTTFENIQSNHQRVQVLHNLAEPIPFEIVPELWQRAPIIHLGPIAQELQPYLPPGFSPSLWGLTPQGWLRSWDEDGHVSTRNWPEAEFVLAKAGAAVISLDDVAGDEERIEMMAHAAPILVVTEGPAGARLYWHGDQRRFCAPEMDEVDPTGAGDIFATAFFIRLYTTRDPWEAARFATQVAARSVLRSGLAGVPRPEEIRACMVEVL